MPAPIEAHVVRGDGQCAGRALARAPEAVSKPTGIALKPPFGCREPSLKISSAHPAKLCKSQHAHTAQGRRRGPRARQLERPGTTHLACGACGSSWAGEHRKRTRRECPKRVVQSPRCPSKDEKYISRRTLFTYIGTRGPRADAGCRNAQCAAPISLAGWRRAHMWCAKFSAIDVPN